MSLLVHEKGALHRVAQALPAGARAVAVLATEPVSAHANAVARALAAAGVDVTCHVMADGEAGKTLGEAERAWAALAGAGLTRDDAVVAVGGGALTDAAGFVAATWLRGVAWVAVPTSTLAMTDAAHGGKVALNTAAGKNLVGAFHEPVAVVQDPEVLSTLGDRDLRAGLVEALKCAWLAGEAVRDPLGGGRDELVLRAAAYKRGLVAADLRERGDRILLNYGHTVGHAVEAASGYGLRHGEAVAIGLVAAAELAELLGVAEAGLAERHRGQLAQLGQPVSWDGRLEDLEPFLRQDKKRGAHGQRWVLLEREGRPVVRGDVPREALAAAVASLAVRA